MGFIPETIKNYFTYLKKGNEKWKLE
jgi:hypothetical protein